VLKGDCNSIRYHY